MRDYTSKLEEQILAKHSVYPIIVNDVSSLCLGDSVSARASDEG